MRTKTSQLILAGAGITSLVALTAVANAKSDRYEVLASVGTDMPTAVELALSAVPGTVVEAELERDDGQYIWEIEIVDDTDQLVSIELDGTTGQVLETEMEDEQIPDLVDSLSLAEAISLLSTENNAVITEAELELENGALVWEFSTIDASNDKAEYYINGVTGEQI